MDVQSLPAGEIDRSAAGAQPQQGGGHVEAPAAEPASESQTAAIAHLTELRKQASDPTLDHGKRDALMHKMSQLSRHAFLGEKSPSWFGAALPDPRLSDTSEYDPMSNLNAPLSEKMSADQLAQMKTAGTVKGLHPTVSGAIASFVSEMAIPKVIADTILDRAVKHLGSTHDEPAFERIETLSSEQQLEYYNEASRVHPGGSEALNRLTTEVRGMLQERGLLERFEKVGLTRTSLAFDARTLYALRLWLQTAPARA